MGRAVSAQDDLIQGKTVTYTVQLDLHDIANALEDLPEDARIQAAVIADVPQRTSLRQRIVDEVENAVLDSYGNLERAPLLHFLSHYPVTPYTYIVSGFMSRGERPAPAKLTDLFGRGHYQATVNLCAEMADGDDPIISAAGLAGQLQTYHIPVVDMAPPEPAQVTQLLSILTGPAAARTYVHCEAGKGRTGVMTACYRMAVMGWSAADALGEAVRFGCSVPMQQAFIQAFGAQLLTQYQARVSHHPLPDQALSLYPLLPPGSVQPNAEELAATVASAALLEAGQVE